MTKLTDAEIQKLEWDARKRDPEQVRLNEAAAKAHEEHHATEDAARKSRAAEAAREAAGNRR